LGTTLAAIGVALLFVAIAGGAPKPPPAQPAGPYQVPSGPISIAAGFAGNDGGMQGTNTSSDYNPTATADPFAPATQPTFDWDSLATNPTYTGTAPFGQASGLTSGWQWVALSDAQKSNSDTGFAGGTKQDDDCAPVIGSGAPNKDDLKRAYVAAKTIGTGANAHTYLTLGWVRVPQNTTSASAHIAFEFNQGLNGACPAGSDGLIHRSAGDLLLVYDFTGGSSVPPTINLARWILSGACDVGADTAPCWGPHTTLSATQAEANVDTGLSHICNANTTPTGCGPSESDHNTGNTLGTKYEVPFQTSDNLAPTNETLSTSEFGEGIVDLTAAGVFTAGTCTNFGQVEAVSRTSGDSGTAAMEDLVGPGTFNLSNCGTIKIIKHTDPRGTDKDFSFCTDVGQPATGGPTYSKTPEANQTSCPTGIATTKFNLNDKFGSVAISSISATDPTVVTTTTAHGLTTGDSVTISGSNSTPSINGTFTVTVITSTTFSITQAVTTAGTAGTVVSDNSTNTEKITNVQPGSYKVTELVPSGWALESLTCAPSDNSLSSFGVRNGTTAEADITIAAEGVVTCTYQDQPTQGAIKITKTGKDKNCAANSTAADGTTGTCTGSVAGGVAYLKNAGFQIWKESNSCAGLQTADNDAACPANTAKDTLVKSESSTALDGTVCFDQLTFSSSQSYYVRESTAPTGYAVDDADAATGFQDYTSVTVDNSAKCDDATFVGETHTFTDTPLTKLTVGVAAVVAGTTNSSITCVVHGTSNNIGNSPEPDSGMGDPENFYADGTHSTNPLKPGTYDCQVVIDP
jgi:hypothetical protein